MRLDDVTPVILTYNEEANVGRVLTRLTWAKEVVVVDSFSTDRTLEIVRGFANARVVQHSFENHAAQWRYAMAEAGIQTDWVLGLDADLTLAEGADSEIAELAPEAAVAGYAARFRYCVQGHPLPRSIFPDRILLFRRDRVSFRQDGHAHQVSVAGRVGRLRHLVDHDDRKPLSRWILSQDVYARLERDKILGAPPGALSGADRIRARRWLAPIAVLVYCLFIKKLILAGFPGWYYTYQRVMAELLLSLYLIEERLAERASR